ncbi:MAG: M50 family metallopeptidase [Candidatus Obscuribacterales bacterium]
MNPLGIFPSKFPPVKQVLSIMLAMALADFLFAYAFGQVVAALVIVFLIIIHEVGHWIPARMMGLSVKTFSVGFGKTIYQYPKPIWGTHFRLSSVPLGGYIVPDDDDMARAPIWKRAVFISGGPLMNLLCAVLITFFSYIVVGEPQAFRPTGSVIAELDSKTTAAYDSGLRVGDEFVNIEGQRVFSAKEVFNALLAHQSSPVAVDVKRGDQVISLKLDHDANGKLGLKGVRQKGYVPYVQVGVLTAAVDAVDKTAEATVATLEWLGKLLYIVPRANEEQVNADQLQSLIGIVQTGGELFQSGLADFWHLLQLLVCLWGCSISCLCLLWTADTCCSSLLRR